MSHNASRPSRAFTHSIRSCIDTRPLQVHSWNQARGQAEDTFLDAIDHGARDIPELGYMASLGTHGALR
eukprot:2944474-Alexandrium_andersonii.AAC.1